MAFKLHAEVKKYHFGNFSDLAAALKYPSQDFKNSFAMGADAMLEGKIRVTPFFKGSIW